MDPYQTGEISSDFAISEMLVNAAASESYFGQFLQARRGSLLSEGSSAIQVFGMVILVIKFVQVREHFHPVDRTFATFAMPIRAFSVIAFVALVCGRRKAFV